MDFLTKNKPILGIIGSVLVIIGCFLPLLSYLGISASWIAGDGKIVVVCAVIAAILIFLKKYKISLVPTFINVILLVSLLINSNGSAAKFEIGFYIIIIGTIIMVAHVFIKENN